jgi:hypothetical protein
MKMLKYWCLFFIITLFTSKIHYAEDSTSVHLSEEVNVFIENIAGFLSKGDISLIEKYIKPSSELIKGKALYKCITVSDKEIFQKEFTEGQNAERPSIKFWSSDGKYYYMLISSSPNKESASYNSLFIEVTKDKNVIVKVWHKG